jgi:hypothetical protein
MTSCRDLAAASAAVGIEGIDGRCGIEGIEGRCGIEGIDGKDKFIFRIGSTPRTADGLTSETHFTIPENPGP